MKPIIRFGAVFHFVWSAFAVFTSAHDILAFLFVGIGLDEQEDWLPLYGSPGQMYTIRRFWGKFRHRLVCRTYLSWGALFSQKILRLRRNDALDRFVTNFTVFFLSGVAHALTTWQIGFSYSYSEDIVWFCLNFAALVAEEGVQWLIIRLFGTWNDNLGCFNSAVRAAVELSSLATEDALLTRDSNVEVVYQPLLREGVTHFHLSSCQLR